MIVDFHVHSTASDGTFTPTEIAEKAKGFAAIALTDHDNCDGIGEWPGITGVELSIEPGKGFRQFHLLGLGIEPEHEQIKKLLKSVLDGRNARNERIFANFQRLGIDIKPEPHGEVLARPHFARWLMEHGYVKTIIEAFEKYLLPTSPKATRCYEERWHPAQEIAFGAIHAAGGVCVMAHPKYWGGTEQEQERELKRLKEAGLDGLEALYQANTGEENVHYVRIAERVGLIKSAGSDFHGRNKPTIPLGMEVSENYIKPLLERLNCNG